MNGSDLSNATHAQWTGALNVNFSSTAEIPTLPSVPEYLVIFQIPMLIVLSVVGTSANLLVIVIIIRSKKLHRPTNYYIMSASINDALCCLIVVNGLNTLYTSAGHWPLGNALCQVRSRFV
jgi:hypothetical protein